MTIPLYALLAAGAWTLVLVSAIAAWRGAELLAGRTPLSGFPSGTPHGSDRYWRLNRAHLNAVENLPLFAIVVLVGTEIGLVSPWFDRAAVLWVVARMGQSIIHVAANTDFSVSVRFTFFLIQIGCLLAIAAEILTRSSG
jgi:uncharacterized MAPEG superfamily protein